ncbi:MAG: tetratricopeptide repeat protein [Nitrospirae bacterium]|nr:MAG: tetratricopeptide repeat protein [Nitrospirota bacterium]
MNIHLRSSITVICLLLLPVFGLSSCATDAKKAPADTPEKNLSLSAEEQDSRALVLFQKIFDLISESDRKTVLPKIEAMYGEIVNDYPKAALGQESYSRLIYIYMNDYDPPAYDKAEELYQRFLKKYPGSQFTNDISDSIAQGYYRNGKWEQLQKFFTPAVKKYIETGKLERPRELFLYAEAKLNLGDLAEAEKGYRIIIAEAPKTKEGSISKQRLDVIQKKKSGKDKK